MLNKFLDMRLLLFRLYAFSAAASNVAGSNPSCVYIPSTVSRVTESGLSLNIRLTPCQKSDTAAASLRRPVLACCAAAKAPPAGGVGGVVSDAGSAVASGSMGSVEVVSGEGVVCCRLRRARLRGTPSAPPARAPAATASPRFSKGSISTPEPLSRSIFCATCSAPV